MTTQTPPAQKPLTDPADLFTLLGRIAASFVLALLTIAFIIRRDIIFTFVFGTISFIFQRMTIGLWRRLRDERIAAEAALTAQEATETEPAA